MAENFIVADHLCLWAGSDVSPSWMTSCGHVYVFDTPSRGAACPWCGGVIGLSGTDEAWDRVMESRKGGECLNTPAR